jgi:SAM-dependent methyltransferase
MNNIKGTNKIQRTKIISGYDNRGEVFDAGDSILRKINKDYFDEVVNIFEFYESFKKNNNDIIETQLLKNKKSLVHKKLTPAYPFEWTPNMFKDALLFHLELFLKLDLHGYTLKDGLPNNVLFDGTTPVFIDFLSLIKIERLKDEKWLVENSNYHDLRYEIFDKMFIPYFILPFLIMTRRDYASARVMLRDKACNMPCSFPTWSDILPKASFVRGIINKIKGECSLGDENTEIIFNFLKQKNVLLFNDFIRRLIALIRDIDVTPSSSGYLSYYNEKKENFDLKNRANWKQKQTNIFEIIKKYKPKRVLDLGANTGWFSILAEKMGAKVVSVEIDESCIDNLYLSARDKKLNIVTLQIALENMKNRYFGIDYPKDKYSEYKNRDFKNNPLFDSAEKRLQSDMTLCLALFHHLILGAGMKVNDVMKTLSNLTTEVLVLEFIGLNDNLIKSNPFFFKNLAMYNERSYNLERIVRSGARFFSKAEVLDSHPSTRKLIVLNK